MSTPPPADQAERLRAAVNGPRPSMLREVWHWLRTNKKWWLLPILLALLAFSALVMLSSSAAAPFIYPLF